MACTGKVSSGNSSLRMKQISFPGQSGIVLGIKISSETAQAQKAGAGSTDNGCRKRGWLWQKKRSRKFLMMER